MTGTGSENPPVPPAAARRASSPSASLLGSRTRAVATTQRRHSVWLDERANVVGLGLAILVLVALFATKSPHFLTVSNFEVIGTAISITGIMAAVSTVVLVSGGLDLSISAVAALGGLIAAKAVAAGLPTGWALLLGLGAGAAAGLVNSVLIVGIGINALIATIGTQFMFRGIDYLSVNGQPVDVFTKAHFIYLGNGTPFGIPMPIFITLGAFALIGALLRFTRFGAHVYAVGGSEPATRLAGVRVGRLRTIVYVLSGISAALAGILLASLNNSAFPDVATGDELQVIAAVILGGTALAGGRGGATGTLLGISMLGILANGLNILGVQSFWQIFVSGAALVLAVAFDAFRTRLRHEA